MHILHIVQAETKSLFSRIYYSVEAEVCDFSAFSNVQVQYNTTTVLQDEANQPLVQVHEHVHFTINLYSKKQFLVSGVNAQK